jgi:energy-coupling factor transport system substrate-specific component
MNARWMKIFCWILLFASVAMMAMGSKAWLALSWAIGGLLTAILLLDFDQKNRDPRAIALTGVMVAVASASRQLIHGIEFSPVFFIVILCGHVFGFTIGFAVGALTMFVSNLFLGHGPWTPFQMVALGLTGGFAILVPRSRGTSFLVVYSVASAYLYGAFTDLFSWIAFIPTHTWESFLAIVVAGIPSDTVRAIGNLLFMGAFAPTMLRILRRFQMRLPQNKTGLYS